MSDSLALHTFQCSVHAMIQTHPCPMCERDYLRTEVERLRTEVTDLRFSLDMSNSLGRNAQLKAEVERLRACILNIKKHTEAFGVDYAERLDLMDYAVRLDLIFELCAALEGKP